jgi:hypothetical protein
MGWIDGWMAGWLFLDDEAKMKGVVVLDRCGRGG